MNSESPFLLACRGRRTERVPVWFMRQAGRALPEYRKTRGDTTLLEAVETPEMAVELTLQPVRRYGVDAAVLFSDIMVPLAAIDFGVEIVKGIGPVIDRPLRSRSDLKRLRKLDPETDTPHVGEAIRILKRELDVPLIGFAGGPYTLASYLIEGGPSTRHHRTKAMMLSEKPLWDDLMERLAELITASLESQVEAGVDALQIFDSWAGFLSPDHYRRFAAPACKKVLDATVRLGAPTILFGLGTGHLLEQMASLGSDVVGLDWRIPLDEGRRRLGSSVAVQGNLDPAVCLAAWEATADEARAVLSQNSGRGGFIFNLGHGVLPETDPGILEKLVELVHCEGGSLPPLQGCEQ